MGVFINNFKAIMWKNCIIRKRHWLMTILEIIIPCGIFGLLALIRYKVGPPSESKIQDDSSSKYIIQPAFELHFYTMSEDLIIFTYTPSNSFTDDVMNKIKENTEEASFGRPHFQLKSMKNENEINRYYESLKSGKYDMNAFERVNFYGIVFDSTDKILKYKIRIGRLKVRDGFMKTSPYENEYYKKYSFATLQQVIDTAYIESVSGKNSSNEYPKIVMQEFPIENEFSGNSDFFLMFSKTLVPFTTLIGFFIILPILILRVVEEKATGAKELMKLMGLRGYMIWLGWLIHCNIVNIIVVTIGTILLTVSLKEDTPSVIPHINPIFVWLLLFLFTNAITMYVFAFCAFFQRPMVALTVGLLFYFIPSFVFSNSAVKKFLNAIHLGFLSGFAPTFAMYQGFEVIFIFALANTAVSFNNLFSSPPYRKYQLKDGVYQFTFGTIILMLILDIFIYAIITWYIDNVRPGPFGRAKPWYFLCLCLKRRKHIDTESGNDQPDTRYFEKPTEGLKVGLFIRNVTKVFPPDIHAVNGVSMDIYDGQITALLGHNGAGKTTTISIITGMYSPTSGTVYQTDTETGETINIFENMGVYRQRLGLCPQENMFFPYFTVIEHLVFFGILKGLSVKQANANGKDLLNSLNMNKKANVRGHQLSGGMQRKLSLAISLIGSPKVLILDEPTSGMDPESRRELWNILLNLRAGRTIIITTHFMEEADALGDRIAIMDHGKVQCYGTPMFLKKAYGAGYNLILLILPNADVANITRFVKKFVAGSELKSHNQDKLVYNLPHEESSRFSDFFAEIEKEKSSLQITNIGVSCTTMEDVFIKVGTIKAKEINEDRSTSRSSMSLLTNTSSEKITGINLCLTRMWLLLLKKIRYTYRTIFSYILYTLIALITLIIIMPPSLNKKKDNVFGMVKLDIGLYKGGEVLEAYDENSGKYASIYKSLITSSVVFLLPNKKMVDELLTILKTDNDRFESKLYVAAEWSSQVLTGTTVTGLFSPSVIHSLPISLNLITNTILKLQNQSYSIVVFNHPLPEPAESPCKADEAYVPSASFVWTFLFPLGLLFVLSYFISFPLHERVTGIKHLQLMTGVSPMTFWFCIFLIDYMLFIITSFILIITVFVLNNYQVVPLFSSAYTYEIFFISIALFGLSGIAFAYFFTFLRKTSTGANGYYIFFNFLFLLASYISLIVKVILMFLQKTSNPFLFVVINYILVVNPYYCFLWIVGNFSTFIYKKSMCDVCHKDYHGDKRALAHVDHHLHCGDIEPLLTVNTEFMGNGIGFFLIILLFDLLFFTFIILLIDYRVTERIYHYLKSIYTKEDDDDNELIPSSGGDDDVLNEMRRVDKVLSDMNEDEPYLLVTPILMVDYLKKTYGLKFRAVQGISFAVSSGECFGLLGVNGAGKTTTFKILVGEIIPSEGDAIIKRFSLLSERSKYLKQIGYCPQFDALNDMMTARELIYLFGRLRRIPRSDCYDVTEYWIEYLGLAEYCDRCCRNYSGGNKRKLSTAMALIGNPVIVFLDEPTSGVDPVARRKLWDVLANCQADGQSIVLTSHSMDECEVLCDRLSIMVGGRFVCIGNIEYLKTKFGKGFTLVIKLQDIEDPDNETRDRLKSDIETTFAPNCILKDEHLTMLNYHLTDTSLLWSTLFNAMEGVKSRFESLVEDYTISETTLEEIFISFAKQNRT